MAGRKRSSPSPIFIGNCKVEVDVDDYSCESVPKGLEITVPNGAKIKISHGGRQFQDYSFVLVNPRDEDSKTKTMVEEALKIYKDQLPGMNFAANTGKESHFIEKCISSGKYKTLVLRSNCSEGHGKVIAAVSYQIIHTDMQFAEVPLAAVSSNCQNRGFGCLLYTELKRRLKDVGVSAILCWADMESEGFWLKQGFTSIGEVDSKGKARRLPIKADIRRALCFPGCSTLMIAHLKDFDAFVNTSRLAKSCPSKPHARLCGSFPIITSEHEENSRNDADLSFCKPESVSVLNQLECIQSQHFLKDGSCRDVLKITGGSAGNIGFPCCGNSAPHTSGSFDKSGYDLDVTVSESNTDGRNSSSGKRMKRRVWGASLSSLKSKRISGGHYADCEDNKDIDFSHLKETDAFPKNYLLGTSGCDLRSVKTTHNNPSDFACMVACAEGRLTSKTSAAVVSRGDFPTIMFMNIADDAKKAGLSKIVEQLGGYVTCDGSSCTHVITGKARRTLNFCVALCSGAWILSSQWLKESFREGKFLSESSYILEDEDYLLKYKNELKDAVIRAQSNPHSLLRGYDVCLAKHIQPSVNVLSSIIRAAGGNVIPKLEVIGDPSRMIFLACEEDMEDALIAAKKGMQTFSSDWFMSCVMKQELDLEAPQFAESL